MFWLLIWITILCYIWFLVEYTSSMNVPSKESGMYAGGRSGNFIVQCTESSYNKLLALKKPMYTDSNGKRRFAEGLFVKK